PTIATTGRGWSGGSGTPPEFATERHGFLPKSVRRVGSLPGLVDAEETVMGMKPCLMKPVYAA
ncbi:MAG: hypothetical protein AAGC99_08545, partial [Pseudomonadota bacterium]